jgi:CPA2 family monovalent cation:H+ antiporter-2
MKYELMDPTTYQFFLAISILTMAITPFFLKKRESLSKSILALSLPSKLNEKFGNEDVPKNPPMEEIGLKDHLVIIGFGLNGHNLAKAARSSNIPYVIIEMNPVTVRKEAANGEPIFFGDASNESVLEHVNIHKARVAVIAISSAAATKRIISNIRYMTTNPYIIVRTRYVNEMEENHKLGADEVIPEEFETSIEIFTRVLGKYLVSRHDIESFTEEVRSFNYEMFRKPSDAAKGRLKIALPEINLVGFKVEKDSGPFINKPLKEAKIRELLGINIVAIRRGDTTMSNISGTMKLKLGDLVYVVGNSEALLAFEKEVEID